MLIKEIKPIGKVGKNLLENKDANTIIETIIEKPMQNACKLCKTKNIESVMSSANRKNIAKDDTKIINKACIIEKTKKSTVVPFDRAGKGYAWIMLNFNTLSDENRKILFNLEQELGEDAIWFVKSSYVDFLNSIRKRFRLKPIVEKFDDNYSKEFEQRQIILMYNNNYPRRAVFIRMPIDEKTNVEDVEKYFNEIIAKLEKQ